MATVVGSMLMSAPPGVWMKKRERSGGARGQKVIWMCLFGCLGDGRRGVLDVVDPGKSLEETPKGEAL